MIETYSRNAVSLGFLCGPLCGHSDTAVFKRVSSQVFLRPKDSAQDPARPVKKSSLPSRTKSHNKAAFSTDTGKRQSRHKAVRTRTPHLRYQARYDVATLFFPETDACKHHDSAPSDRYTIRRVRARVGLPWGVPCGSGDSVVFQGFCAALATTTLPRERAGCQQHFKMRLIQICCRQSFAPAG